MRRPRPARRWSPARTAGNIAAFAAEHEHGLVLPDEKVLADWFESGEILQAGPRPARGKLHDLAFSALSAELVES